MSHFLCTAFVRWCWRETLQSGYIPVACPLLHLYRSQYVFIAIYLMTLSSVHVFICDTVNLGNTRYFKYFISSLQLGSAFGVWTCKFISLMYATDDDYAIKRGSSLKQYDIVCIYLYCIFMNVL